MPDTATSPKKRIYCVEDDNALLAVYAISFSSEQYDLALFSSGAVCLECMDRVFPDLIFLDLNLPDMDGFGFLEQLGCRFPQTRLPVVIVSSIANAPAVKRAKDFNVRAYFIKPLSPEKIASFADEVFEQLLQPPETAAATTAAFAGCIQRQEEILIVDFERFSQLDEPDSFKNFFDRAAKTGLIIDLGKMSVEAISQVDTFGKLHRLYRNRNGFNKVKIFAQNDFVLRFLINLGKFVKTDLFLNLNAAILNIRIGVEFHLEE